MLLLIMLRTLPRDHFEVLVKAGEVVEPTLEAKLFNADPIVYK